MTDCPRLRRAAKLGTLIALAITLVLMAFSLLTVLQMLKAAGKADSQEQVTWPTSKK